MYLMKYTVSCWWTNRYKLLACISTNSTTLRGNKEQAWVAVKEAARPSCGRSTVYQHMHSWFPPALLCLCSNGSNCERSISDTHNTWRVRTKDCTIVVVSEAHSHEVFGWAVVIHLVTPENTHHFFKDKSMSRCCFFTTVKKVALAGPDRIKLAPQWAMNPHTM